MMSRDEFAFLDDVDNAACLSIDLVSGSTTAAEAKKPVEEIKAAVETKKAKILVKMFDEKWHSV